MKQIPTIPLKELLMRLKPYIDTDDVNNYEVSFSGLTFYRPTLRSDSVIQIEFEETVYRNSQDRVVVENHKEEKS